MPLDLTNDKSTLIQVMAWCRQATSHYLSQYCPRSMSPNGVTRPQWVNTLLLDQNGCHFMIFSNAFSWGKNFCIFIQISWSLFLKELINNKSGFIQAMAWWPAGDKPFSAPVMAWFMDIYICILLMYYEYMGNCVCWPQWVKPGLIALEMPAKQNLHNFTDDSLDWHVLMLFLIISVIRAQ